MPATASDAAWSNLLGEFAKQLISGHLEPVDFRDEAVPETVGRYEIARPKGRGAHSRLYEAFDPLLGRAVELRVFGGLDDRRRRRLLRDLQILSKIEHDAVARVLDAGVDEAAGVFLITEHLDTPSLADVSLSLKESVRVLATAARACHAGHKQGVHHRDLRPANLLVGGRPVLTGLGVLHLLGDDERLNADYKAPEQLTGREAVGPWTDVYALGAMLYEQLAGRPPLDGSDGEAPIPPPSSLNAEAPLELEQIAMRALKTFPEERHRSAEAFADELEGWLIEPQPVSLAVAWSITLAILALVMIALFSLLGSGA